jgi:hypothetical protein
MSLSLPDSFLLFFSLVEIASHYSFATVLAIAETFSAAAFDGGSIIQSYIHRLLSSRRHFLALGVLPRPSISSLTITTITVVDVVVLTLLFGLARRAIISDASLGS